MNASQQCTSNKSEYLLFAMLNSMAQAWLIAESTKAGHTAATFYPKMEGICLYQRFLTCLVQLFLKRNQQIKIAALLLNNNVYIKKRLITTAIDRKF
jgi:hypothetical protein